MSYDDDTFHSRVIWVIGHRTLCAVATSPLARPITVNSHDARDDILVWHSIVLISVELMT